MIELNNVSKTFKVKQKQGFFKDLFSPTFVPVHAVNNVSFSIQIGELIGFIGPNGAGKTTTIKMLTGILWPSSGTITVNGVEPYRKRKEYVKTIGAVFGQRKSLWPELSVIDNLELIGAMYKLTKKQVYKRVAELSHILQLDEFLKRPFRKLSLGQQMKSELASALLHKPKILFLDEPTIGMDIVAKESFIELLKQINETEKTTILLTSHDLGEIEQLCKRIVLINKGKVLYDGDIKKIRPNKIIVKHSSKKGPVEKIMSKQALKSYLQKIDVSDLEVNEIPLEQVIRELYER